MCFLYMCEPMRLISPEITHMYCVCSLQEKGRRNNLYKCCNYDGSLWLVSLWRSWADPRPSACLPEYISWCTLWVWVAWEQWGSGGDIFNIQPQFTEQTLLTHTSCRRLTKATSPEHQEGSPNVTQSITDSQAQNQLFVGFFKETGFSI